MKRWLTQRLMTRSRRQLAAVVTLLLVLAAFLALALHAATRPEAQEKAWYNLPAPCRLPDSTLDSLAALAVSMHAALQSLHVPHVLCYGTLWGALRTGRILPWDTNIDMCAMDLHFANVSASQLQGVFGKRGMELLYDWRRGAVQGLLPRRSRARLHLRVHQSGLLLVVVGRPDRGRGDGCARGLEPGGVEVVRAEADIVPSVAAASSLSNGEVPRERLPRPARRAGTAEVLVPQRLVAGGQTSRLSLTELDKVKCQLPLRCGSLGVGRIKTLLDVCQVLLIRAGWRIKSPRLFLNWNSPWCL